MATRSNIIVERSDGSWAKVYCHWDGYLEGVGKTLCEHYDSQEYAEAVVAPGDLSSLQEHCDCPKGHSYNAPMKGYSIYYGRDRGESDIEAKITPTLSAAWPGSDTGVEFIYVWKREGGWFVGDADEGSKTLRPLKDALAGIDPPKPNIKAFGGNFVIGRRK